MNTIAVIIPAFKASYLQQCLKSFKAQTNQNFELYIFDDNSPYGLHDIAKPYLIQDNFNYHHFDQNLGGTSLVEQWERCISATSEKWIWLFSDDDLVSSDAIENLYQCIKEYPQNHLLRFNKKMLNRTGNTTAFEALPHHLSIQSFYKQIVYKRYSVTLPEFVFNRQLYNRKGGFVKFDLAWGTDKATWIEFAKENGVLTIPNATVTFRMSGENISSIDKGGFFDRKVNALLEYYLWHKGQNELCTEEDLNKIKDSILWYIKTNISQVSILNILGLSLNLSKTFSSSRIRLISFLVKCKLYNE
ncbi:MAG: glycosyltransferase family 2 protein [Reichenbachiella sp.]